MSLEEIVAEIELKSNLSKEEILDKINKKYEELSGLITKEGAAYIVARELNVDLAVEKKRRLQAKNIFPGMKNINFVGRVFKISPINEFLRQGGSKGKVCNLFIGDETGFVKLPLWNDQVKILEDRLIQVGDLIQITNGIARENVYGDLEIVLGRFGHIHAIENSEEFPSAEELNNKFFSIPNKRIFIKDVKEGYNLIIGTIVHLFKSKFIFEVCSICGSPLSKKRCSVHGGAEANQALMISGIIDDGTENLRFVLFRELAEKLLGSKVTEFLEIEEGKRYEFVKGKILGKEVEFLGRVKKSNITNDWEMIVSEVKDLNALEESKKLVEELELILR